MLQTKKKGKNLFIHYSLITKQIIRKIPSLLTETNNEITDIFYSRVEISLISYKDQIRFHTVQT